MVNTVTAAALLAEAQQRGKADKDEFQKIAVVVKATDATGLASLHYEKEFAQAMLSQLAYVQETVAYAIRCAEADAYVTVMYSAGLAVVRAYLLSLGISEASITVQKAIKDKYPGSNLVTQEPDHTYQVAVALYEIYARALGVVT
jgi:hypothetical protein